MVEPHAGCFPDLVRPWQLSAASGCSSAPGTPLVALRGPQLPRRILAGGRLVRSLPNLVLAHARAGSARGGSISPPIHEKLVRAEEARDNRDDDRRHYAPHPFLLNKSTNNSVFNGALTTD